MELRLKLGGRQAEQIKAFLEMEEKNKKWEDRIFFPIDKYPDTNFKGIIIGSRGANQKRMCSEFNVKIEVSTLLSRTRRTQLHGTFCIIHCNGSLGEGQGGEAEGGYGADGRGPHAATCQGRKEERGEGGEKENGGGRENGKQLLFGEGRATTTYSSYTCLKITAPDEATLERAKEEIMKLMRPLTDEERSKAMREIAIDNGTLRAVMVCHNCGKEV